MRGVVPERIDLVVHLGGILENAKQLRRICSSSGMISSCRSMAASTASRSNLPVARFIRSSISLNSIP